MSVNLVDSLFSIIHLPIQSLIPSQSPVIPIYIPQNPLFPFFSCQIINRHHHYINSPIMHAAYLRTEADSPRGTDKHCHDCNKKFTIGVREHQCKRCLKPVCSDCGNFRREVFSSTALQLKEHRVCRNCHQASSCIADCIKNEDLRFGQTRDSGRKWLKRMMVKPATSGTDSSQHSVFTKQAFASLWGSYSCELRELVGLLTYRYKQEGVFQTVYSVFTTVVSAAPQFSFSQVIHLVVYVLCFCSEDKAALIVLFLLEIKQAEKDFRAMAFNYLRALPFKNELQKLEGYISYRLERYSDSFFVNCMTLECSKALISKTFQKKSIEQSLIFFATHIYLNREVLVSKIGDSKGNLDAIMLRNCKLEQLTSCYKYFKGKNFTTDQREPALEDLDHLSLRKMKTLNYQSSYSPKESVNDRNRLRLVSREIQESKEGMDDSFSFYLQPEKENTLKNMQSDITKPPSDVFQLSPQLIVITPAYNQDSPFRKSAPQETTPPNSDILFPSFLQASPARKSLESASQSDPNKNTKSCQNCVTLQERYDELSKRYTEQRRRWQEQKQAAEQTSVMQEFAKKSRIAELQKMNMQSQAQTKHLQERVDQLVQQRHKGHELLQKTRNENKDLNQRLISQTNQSIKLSAVIEKERKNVRQAREMCLDANRINEVLKVRVSELQGAISELGKKETNWKQFNDAQETVTRDYKAKISLLEERNSALQKRIFGLQQQNGNNSKLEALLAEMKMKIAGLQQTINNKDKVLSEMSFMLLQREEVTKGLNQQLITSKREKDFLQGQMRALKMSLQARQAQVISLKTYFSKDSSEQVRVHQQKISQYSLRIQELGRQMMEKQDQLQSLKKQGQGFNATIAQLNAKLADKQEMINNLTEELKVCKVDNQRLLSENRLLKTTIQQLKVYQKKSEQSQMRITDLTNTLMLKQENLSSLKKSTHLMQGNVQQLNTILENKESIIKQLNYQLQTTKIQMQKLQQEVTHLKISTQKLELSRQDTSQSSILISQLTKTLASRQNQIQSLKKQNNFLNMNILELKLQGKKLKEEAVRLKLQKETDETRNKETINQLQESLSVLSLQIQAIKREKQRVQEPVFIMPPQRTSEKSEEQRSSCQSLSARESQITMLTELTERQAKVIQQLSREIREIEVSKGMMSEKLASSTLVLKNSQKNIGDLQGEVAILRQRNERMMERNDILTQEVNVLKKQLVLVRSQIDENKNEQIHRLKQALSATQGKHKELLSKFQSISELMMEIQEEKIQLADELFILHEFLKKRGISVPK